MRKKILISAATFSEVKFFCKNLKFIREIYSYLFVYQYFNFEIHILITGVGIIPTVFRLTKICSQENYDVALNVGIAGSFNKNIPIGEVVEVIEEEFSDWGIEFSDSFLTVFEKNLQNPKEFPFVDGKLKNPNISNFNLLKIKGLTSNTAHGNEKNIEFLEKKFNADIETMEGAAFFYVSLHQDFSFFAVRSISNFVEKRNEKLWNIPLAINELTKFLIHFLENYGRTEN